MVDALERESIKFADFESTSNDGFTHGKRQTFYTDLDGDGFVKGRPRSAIEQAIELLIRLDFPDAAERAVIKGAEWWVQRRRPRETIGFHYDKDEALASDRGILRCPAESTVTYLGDAGGPTFIVNRTTPDGNGADPLLPLRATAVYPRRNRHIVFRGNLAHGVAGGLSHSSAGKRITLLVNWWEEKPIEPNCVRVPDARYGELGIAPLPRGAATALRPTHAAVTPAEADNVSFAEEMTDDQLEMHSVELRSTDHYHFLVPKGSTKACKQGSGVMELDFAHWEPRARRQLAWSQMGFLDLENQQQMDYLWRSVEPKVVVWVGAGKRDTVLRVLLGVARRHITEMSFFVADPATTGDALEAFGLGAADVARRGAVVAVHDTHDDDQKYVMDAHEGELTAEAVEAFLAAFRGGELAALQLDDDEL
eukprot:g8083.t1